MNIFNMYEAKAILLKLINQMVIAPYKKHLLSRKGGQLKNVIWISDDFYEPLLPEYLDLFYHGIK